MSYTLCYKMWNLNRVWSSTRGINETTLLYLLGFSASEMYPDTHPHGQYNITAICSKHIKRSLLIAPIKRTRQSRHFASAWVRQDNNRRKKRASNSLSSQMKKKTKTIAKTDCNKLTWFIRQHVYPCSTKLHVCKDRSLCLPTRGETKTPVCQNGTRLPLWVLLPCLLCSGCMSQS